jgi:pyruvate dehydrogenase E1 component
VNAEAITAATLASLSREGAFDAARAAQAVTDLGLDPERGDPALA